MSPGTLNTILNTAPMIIQGAGKLIKLIRDRESQASQGSTGEASSIEDLKQEISRIETRLHENSRSDVEQIRLIEDLAKQNELIAESLRTSLWRTTILTYVAISALAASAATLLYVIMAS